MTETQEQMTASVNALKSVLILLPASDAKFGKDLVNAFVFKGGLSEKQWPWVSKLIARATKTETPPPPKAVEIVGNFAGVIDLFKKAKENLKFPKIVLKVGEQRIALSLAGSNSSAPGTVQVTDGGSYGNNKWFGRVTPAGEWQKSHAVSTTDAEAIGSFLQKFGADPSGTAKEYGTMTGRCCFCAGKLTDVRSTAAGYGQTCAKNYGLLDKWKTASKSI